MRYAIVLLFTLYAAVPTTSSIGKKYVYIVY